MTRKSKGKPKDDESGESLGGFVGGLVQLVEKLGELAEKGKELRETGEISDLGGSKQLKGVYGFNVKVGLGEDRDKIKVEPFGNIKRDKKTGQTVVQEVREPMVDVFEEEEHILIVAEMPGIGSDDVRLEVKDDVLTVLAEKGAKKYRKEILLPVAVPMERIAMACNNGMLEIKCLK